MTTLPLTLCTSMLQACDQSRFRGNVCVASTAADSDLHSTFEKWKSSRALLSTAVREYLAASTSLQSACIIPATKASERDLTKDIMLAIDSELKPLEDEELSLREMRVSLVAIRNSSPALALVNRLPPEILASIFTLSKMHCFHDSGSKSSFYNLPGVCTYWRSIATTLPGMWNHIDVGPDTPLAVTNLLLQRTGHQAIHLHVHEPRPPNDLPTAEHKVAEVLNILGCHGKRVRTLDLETYSYSRSLVGPVLSRWLSMGNNNTTKTLLVYRPKAGMMLTPEGYNTNMTLASRSENANAALGHLTKLHLQNVRFDWDSRAYRNLVDLQLSCFCNPTSISMPEFMSILSENPRLAILKLSSLGITSPDDWVCRAPITMSALRILNLFHIDGDGLRLLLSSIRLPTSPIEVGIGPAPFGQVYNELETFLANTQLISFYCWQDKTEPFPGWVSMLRLAPYLRNLVMDELQMTGKLFAETNTGGPQAFSPPHIDCVIFLDSDLTLDGLKALVNVCGIRSLRLERCRPPVDESGGMENIRASLAEAYPDLECIVSDQATTGQLEYCKIFER
ncbi:F-box-like protein [Ceratobasidium sp. AG-Ba]|nr:F-box-like protein [Ceratobasidium sp. AG-Ba]QRW01377.1 F-box-like protein [Ceratobasidium sp. AG-Ba]